MESVENDLWPQDKETLDKLISNPVSENERNFFIRLREKMQNELAPCKEVHFSEKDNADGIFLLRDGYDEFIVGTEKDDVPNDYIHVMCLSDALLINLKSAGFVDRNITVLDWLRERDYKGAMFDHNNAYL